MKNNSAVKGTVNKVIKIIKKSGRNSHVKCKQIHGQGTIFNEALA
jgi:hypothetical protein